MISTVLGWLGGIGWQTYALAGAGLALTIAVNGWLDAHERLGAARQVVANRDAAIEGQAATIDDMRARLAEQKRRAEQAQALLVERQRERAALADRVARLKTELEDMANADPQIRDWGSERVPPAVLERLRCVPACPDRQDGGESGN